jgi:predicted phage terminase large subunit-like protein
MTSFYRELREAESRVTSDHVKRMMKLTEDDIELITEYYASQARRNLWAYRNFMDDTLIKGWFAKDLSDNLQQFFLDLKAGKRPKLVIEAPPQHGKSRGMHDAITWFAGMDPDLKMIFASFSSDLGTAANSHVQRTLDDERYPLVFPDTTIGTSNVVTQVGRAKRNSRFIEFVGHRGSFRNTTINGQINGKTLDIGLIDDPIKGRAAASSKAMRDKIWTWFTDDFFTRFNDLAGMILTATRWDLDDPTGRFMNFFPDATVISYPALSTKESIERDYDLRTELDVPLFPEFKSKTFLEDRRRFMTVASWESLYQQSPIVVGGGIFPVDRVPVVQAMPEDKEIKATVRYWDKAGTQDGGAFTCGVRMHSLKTGGWIVTDVVRGQWNAWERERMIKKTAESDAERFGRRNVRIITEQEPGSGGKESAERTIEMLAGYPVYKDKVTGSKELRAEPYAAQWQGGNISVLRNQKWNDPFFYEHEAFPSGKYKDQVDASAGAFAQLAQTDNSYDESMKWARYL